ncbi:MAG: non-canonical purine NTP pyrophosphatase, RdgB/HAM1 family [Chloroflexi bacterium RBG_16_57_11]|nr:MAG: non-canonical purine NTP pyrophosphatase, RdgB/HAM1 family [Chloroflexi bacterium RBG_16_57_11]
MSKILVATHNAGKLEEIWALLNGIPAELVAPADINLDLAVKETGSNYAENAALKAVAYAKASGLITLADDSGLEVDALDSLPGLHSARFAPWTGASDADRRRLLLERLQPKTPPWTAHFRCIVALARPSGETQYTQGICPGVIIPEERGEKGFGYDPIFLLPELGKTMAELDMEEKNRLSHRGRAVRAAYPILLEMLKNL